MKNYAMHVMKKKVITCTKAFGNWKLMFVNAVNEHAVFASKTHRCMDIKARSSNTCSMASIATKIRNKCLIEMSNFKIKCANVGRD